jgi:hypothetical protein
MNNVDKLKRLFASVDEISNMANNMKPINLYSCWFESGTNIPDNNDWRLKFKFLQDGNIEPAIEYKLDSKTGKNRLRSDNYMEKRNRLVENMLLSQCKQAILDGFYALDDDTKVKEFKKLFLEKDTLQQENKLLKHRLETADDFIESRKNNMIIDHYNDLKYILNECDMESTW